MQKQIKIDNVMRITTEIEKIFNETRDLVLRKNADYGSSFLESPKLLAKSDNSFPIPIEELGIIVRISDKIARIQNLLKGLNETSNPKVSNESLEDSITDLMGYCGLWLVTKRLRNDSTHNAQHIKEESDEEIL